jgi:hypothetical protein
MLRCVHRILHVLTSKNIYCTYVRLPPDDTSFSDSILGTRRQRKFIPFFNGCLGALDGTHIPAHVPEAVRPAYRNRKGDISQNVLMVCTVDMKIVYVQLGGRAAPPTVAYSKMLGPQTSGSHLDVTI